MVTLTTKGIKISVETFYQSQHSRPQLNKYTYAYRITIHNCSSTTVQLLRRQWFIFDSNGSLREVEGEGVIGEQPVLQPGQQHQYTSWTPMSTSIGKMYGSYLMRRQSDDRLFRVSIPEFQLIAPSKLN